MYVLLEYLKEMVIIAVPAVIIFSCFWPYRKRALYAMDLQTNCLHEIAIVLFIMIFFGVLAVTLWPVYIIENSPGLWGDIKLLTDRPSLWSNVNLVPFRMFVDYWEDLNKGGIFIFATILNFVGNLIIFMPLGFLPSLIWRGETWRRAFFVGAGTSALIEVGQYFLMRQTDIDDIILNTFGAICGYWIFLMLRHFWPSFAIRFKCTKKI